MPGGVGTALKASRAGGALAKAQLIDQTINVGQGLIQSRDAFSERNNVSGAFYAGMSALGVRGVGANPFQFRARAGVAPSGLGGVDIVPKGGVPGQLKAASATPAPPAPRSSTEVLQELFDANDYTRRVGGRHHLTPKALGNELRYGHKSLTNLGEMKHTVMQGALDNHFRGVTKTLSNGKTVDMLPRRGNPGARVRRVFSLDERVQAVDDFYKTFASGRFYPAFRMELNAARKAGKLR